jgi:hypothetical protein
LGLPTSNYYSFLTARVHSKYPAQSALAPCPITLLPNLLNIRQFWQKRKNAIMTFNYKVNYHSIKSTPPEDCPSFGGGNLGLFPAHTLILTLPGFIND